MAFDGTSGRILIAALPVAAMLVVEIVLPRWRMRRGSGVGHGTPAHDLTRQGISPADGEEQGGVSANEARRQPRRRQDDCYFQALYKAAQSGSLSAMNKLGEFALVRRNFVESFYWKLLLEMRHGKSSGLPAQGVCRIWQDVGCPAPAADEGGSFTENQSKLAMAVLDLWSGRHVYTPKETIRKMAEEGDKDALLYARRFGIGHARS